MSVPHTIHYCWFGGKPIPERYQSYMKSWKKYCPGFTIQRWDESNFDISSNDYIREAYEKGKYAFVSDYVRLAVVYKFGGVYFDVDVELLKSIDELVKGKGFLARQTDGKIATGLGFAAEAGDEIIGKILSAYENIHFIKKSGEYDITPCPDRNTESVEEFFKTDKAENFIAPNGMMILEPKYMCPMDFKTGILDVSDETISIHWFDASWYNKRQRACSMIKRRIRKTFAVCRKTGKRFLYIFSH